MGPIATLDIIYYASIMVACRSVSASITLEIYCMKLSSMVKGSPVTKCF